MPADAAGIFNLRKVDGWQTLATQPIAQPDDRDHPVIQFNIAVEPGVRHLRVRGLTCSRLPCQSVHSWSISRRLHQRSALSSTICGAGLT
jgi:hypothetical protein